MYDKKRLLTIAMSDIDSALFATLFAAILTALAISIMSPCPFFTHISKPVWVFAIARFYQLFDRRLNRYARISTSMFGFVLWSAVAASAIINTTEQPLRIVYLVPLIMEIWITGRALLEKPTTTRITTNDRRRKHK
jgi:hypothetical protein